MYPLCTPQGSIRAVFGSLVTYQITGFPVVCGHPHIGVPVVLFGNIGPFIRVSFSYPQKKNGPKPVMVSILSTFTTVCHCDLWGQQSPAEDRKGPGGPTVCPHLISSAYLCKWRDCSDIPKWKPAPAAPPAAVRRAAPAASSPYGCPCSSSNNCYGPRGGRYCITSGGNKRYR